MLGVSEVGIQCAQATDQNRHLGRCQSQQIRFIHQQLLAAADPSFGLCGCSCGNRLAGRLQYSERVHIGLLLRRDPSAPGEKGTITSWPAFFAAASRTPRAAAQNDQVSERDLLPAGLGAIEILLDRFQCLKDLCEFGRLVDFPILLRGETNARTVGPAPLVAAAKRCGRRPGRCDQLRDGKSRCEDFRLSMQQYPHGRRSVYDPLREQGILAGHMSGSFGTSGPRYRERGPISRCVSLYHRRLGESVCELFRIIEVVLRKSSCSSDP